MGRLVGQGPAWCQGKQREALVSLQRVLLSSGTGKVFKALYALHVALVLSLLSAPEGGGNAHYMLQIHPAICNTLMLSGSSPSCNTWN